MVLSFFLELFLKGPTKEKRWWPKEQVYAFLAQTDKEKEERNKSRTHHGVYLG
jgi:hypothetical protein